MPVGSLEGVIPIDTAELTKARDLLQKGEVVAIPTETVYGLAASIESEAGLRKIFALKERPFLIRSSFTLSHSNKLNPLFRAGLLLRIF